MKKTGFGFFSILSAFSLVAQNPQAPQSLRCNLMEHTDRVYVNGKISQISLSETDKLVESVQLALIESKQPSFSWTIADDRQNIMQTAFQLQLGTTEKTIGDIWNTKKQEGNQSMIQFAGKSLQPQTTYYWRVKLWNNKGEETPWSAIKSFKTGDRLKSYASSSYPLLQTDENFVSDREIQKGVHFYDFGKAAFGRIKITIDTKLKNDTLTVRFGEVITKNNLIDSNPGESRRYRKVTLPLMQGKHTYVIAIKKDIRNTGKAAIPMPNYIGDD